MILTYITCSSCLQLARGFGASDIIAVDVQDEKLQKAKIFGATHTINALQEDPVEKIRVCTLTYCVAYKFYQWFFLDKNVNRERALLKVFTCFLLFMYLCTTIGHGCETIVCHFIIQLSLCLGRCFFELKASYFVFRTCISTIVFRFCFVSSLSLLLL